MNEGHTAVRPARRKLVLPASRSQVEFGNERDAGEPPFAYARDHWARAQEDLEELLAIPSVSGPLGCAAGTPYPPFLEPAAHWLAAKLRRIGMARAEVLAHNIVYAETAPEKGKFTILLYGHYDVKDPGPLDDWRRFPFDPRVNGHDVVARGAADMKGALWAMLLALESLIQSKRVPLNIKVLIAGDQEIGSPHTPLFIKGNGALLACDAAISLDGEMQDEATAFIDCAGRGRALYDLEVTRVNPSATSQGVKRHPADVLCQLIGTLKAIQPRQSIPGFQDDLRGDLIVSSLASDGESEAACIEVNGLGAALLGDKAAARITVRLVPDQDAKAIQEGLAAALGEGCPPGFNLDVRLVGLTPWYRASGESLVVTHAAAALTVAFGKPAVRRYLSKPNPVLASFQHVLKAPPIRVGFRMPADCGHHPNERQSLPVLVKGTHAMIHFLLRFLVMMQ